MAPVLSGNGLIRNAKWEENNRENPGQNLLNSTEWAIWQGIRYE